MRLAPIYRQIAIGDLLLFVTLALPGLGGRILQLLLDLNAHLQWPGELETSAAVFLLLHLLGVMGLGFAGLRLSLGPQRDATIITVMIKLAAVALFIGFVLKGAPAVFLLLAVADSLQALLLMVALKLNPQKH